MGGAGWSLKGPQPRLQESLASSSTPLLDIPLPSPLLSLPANWVYWPTLFRPSPIGSGESSGPVGTTLNCAFPYSPRD